MNEVSCKVSADWIAFLHDKGIPPQRLIDGLTPPVGEETRLNLDYLANGNNRISWNFFAALCDRFFILLGNRAAQEEFVAFTFTGTRTWLAPVRHVLSCFADPTQLIRMLTQWVGTNVFSNASGQYKELADGRLQVEVHTGDARYAHSDAFFRCIEIGLKLVPTFIGRQPAQIETVIENRNARYLVTLPPSKPIRTRIRRALQLIFHMRATLSDMRAYEDELREAYQQMSSAQRELHETRRELEERVENRTRELALAKEQAEAANRAKTAFLANMSHELRSPLAAILGFTELLGKEPLTPPAEQYVGIIDRNGRNLLQIVNDLLDLAKIEAGRLDTENRTFDVEHEVVQVVAALRSQADAKGIALTLHASEKLPQLTIGDPTRVRQIAINIIGNAVKFTRDGHVQVRLDCESAPAQRDSRLVKLVVRDTGVGIARQDWETIFKPFTQVDPFRTRTYGGTGLGLTLAKRMAQSLGGDVLLETSEIGRGSTFVATFQVQLAPDQIHESRKLLMQARAKDVQRRLEGARVLIVDDRQDMQFLFRTILINEGAAVELASDGEDGLVKARRAEFDVVLLDIQMPRLDGFGVVQTLRREGYQMPIVALTSYARPEEQALCLRSGFNDHLSKPVEASDLIDSVSRWFKAGKHPAQPVS